VNNSEVTTASLNKRERTILRNNVTPMKRLTWEQSEGSPLPLGVTWIEAEQAFNFAIHSEHAESVTLLLYASTDLVNPLLTYRFDYLLNKSGRIWHCRIPAIELRECSYYGYSVSGQAISSIHSFDPQTQVGRL
jgi:isoamylase